MNKTLLNQIFLVINQANHITIVSHQNPDGDTLGANSAFMLFLDSNQKNFNSFCKDPVPEIYKYLKYSHRISNNLSIFENPNLDLIIFLDCADLKYAGIKDILEQKKLSNQCPFIINIDHHFSNPAYGDLNLIEPSASSTCEIIFQLFDFYKIPLTCDMATALLTGLIGDTGCFTNAATSIASLKIAGELLKQGVNFKKIENNIFRSKSIENLKLWSAAFSRLKFNPQTNMATTVVKESDILEANQPPETLDGLSNFLSGVLKSQALLVLQELKDGWIKGGLRSLSDDIDVSKIAQKFGGGGHKKAAGFKIQGKIVEEENEWKIAN